MEIPLNIPFSYLHRVNARQFILSTLLRTSKAYYRRDGTDDDKMIIQWVHYLEIHGGGTEIDQRIPLQVDRNIRVETRVLPMPANPEMKAVPATDTKKCSFLSEDYREDLGNFPASKALLPHIYFRYDVREDLPYKMWFAIRTRPGFAFSKPVVLDQIYQDPFPPNETYRKIVIRETKGPAISEIWVDETDDFDQIGEADKIEIHVISGDEVVCKGKVRHSIADNKPFDLDGL